MSEKMSEEETKVLGFGLQVAILISSFIYTAITLLLLGLEDPSIILWQVNLFALQIAFALLLFDTFMTLLFAYQVMWKRIPPPKPLYIANILHIIGLFIWMLSISVMFFARNLPFHGATQVLITLIGFPLIGRFFTFQKSPKKE